MAFSIWPFSRPPPPKNLIFPSLPTWATVGIDITPEELVVFFRPEPASRISLVFSAIEPVLPYLPVIFLAFFAFNVHKIFKRKLIKASLVSNILHLISHPGLEEYLA
jgi:hypothetical protein